MSNPRKSSQELIASCQGLVRSLAWKIHRRLPSHVELEDLVGYGQVGLVEAARDFDPERGNQFTTYAYYRIRGAIFDGLSKMSWFNQADYSSGRYERMADEFLSQGDEGEQEREVSDGIHWLKKTSGALAVVYLFCRDASSDDSGNDVADRRGEAPEDRAMRAELCEKLHHLVDELPELAQQLIRSAYFEGMSLTEASHRLGVSKAWASRLHARTLEQLARSLRLQNVE